MNNTTKILAALAVGAVAGAVLGILFAPDKGSDTRKKINEQGKKLGQDLKNKFNEVKEKMACKEETVRNETEPA